MNPLMTRAFAMAAAAALVVPPALAGESALHILLKPLAANDGSAIAIIEVRETLVGRRLPPEEALLELAHLTFNVPSAASRVQLLGASDEEGPLDLVAVDRGEDEAAVRQWFADRETRGDVTVVYRVAVKSSLASRGAAPPTELRNEAGAISGSGSSFILRPPGGDYVMSVDWDLAELPPASTAVSSLDYGPTEVLPADTLDSVYFMAGKLGYYPQNTTRSGFFSAWQGRPPFDAPRLMAMAEALREQFIAFFDAPRSGYGIMMRPNPVNPGGGIGLHRSFVITFDDSTQVDDLEITLAHEMFHTYQPRMDNGEGPNSNLAGAWFNEGLAVFYQREFLFRAGLIESGAYLVDLNRHAARYYTNALGHTPNSEVAAGFWRDTRIRTLPYDRGFLYFATVDEAVRNNSNGRRSLDNLIQAMRKKQDRGRSLTTADWQAEVGRELGREGIAALQDMLSGAAPLPSSGAFGPCFRRVERFLQRYELGFEPAVLVEPGRVVRDVLPGSAAARAGLRNGDRILKPVPQDAIQGDQEAMLTLLILRGREEFSLSYRPRGETVSAWQWQRIEEVPEEVCRAAREREQTTSTRLPRMPPGSR